MQFLSYKGLRRCVVVCQVQFSSHKSLRKAGRNLARAILVPQVIQMTGRCSASAVYNLSKAGKSFWRFGKHSFDHVNAQETGRCLEHAVFVRQRPRKPVKVHTGSPSPVFVPQTVEKTGGHKDLEFSILKGLEKLAEV